MKVSHGRSLKLLLKITIEKRYRGEYRGIKLETQFYLMIQLMYFYKK